MYNLPDTAILLLSDARGVYIPRDFTSFIDFTRVRNVTPDDYAILAIGPDHREYWEAWCTILDNAIVTDTDGNEYYLHQDGDLWAIPIDVNLSEED
jgi:hypothetical protein